MTEPAGPVATAPTAAAPTPARPAAAGPTPAGPTPAGPTPAGLAEPAPAASVTPDTAGAWLDRLVAGWLARNPAAIAELFTEDASYHRGPFEPERHGPKAIAAHWAATLAGQRENPAVWMSEPVVSGDRAAAEYWCILADPDTGTPRSVGGALLLRFAPDGRCTQFHEYYSARQRVAQAPSPGWFG